MFAGAANQSNFVGRQIFVFVLTVGLGLVVGVASALFPPVVPIGIVGLGATFLLWVLPDTRTVPNFFASRVFIVFMFSTLCVPIYYAIILPGIPWLSFRRAVLFPFVALVCYIMATSASNRAIVVTGLKSVLPISIPLFGLLFSIVISTFMAIRPAEAMNSDFQFTVGVLVPMLAVIVLVRTEKAVLGLFKMLIVCIGFDLIIGLVEHFLRRPFLIYLLPSYMRQQIVASNPLAAISLVNGQGIRNGMYRSASIFGVSLSWGEASAMIAPVCLHFIAHGRTRIERSCGVLGVFMCFLSVVLSGSRGAYVGMMVAVVVYTLVWAARHCRVHPKSLAGRIWLFMYAMASLATVLAVFFIGRIHKVVLGGGEVQSSGNARSVEWLLAKPHILSRPLWGHGGGAANQVIGYAPAPDAPFTVDGYYMNLLVDYGIPGFVFFFALFLGAAWICLNGYYRDSSEQRTWAGAVGASLIAFIIYRTTLSSLDNMPLAFVIVGLAFVCGTSKSHVGAHGGAYLSRNPRG